MLLAVDRQLGLPQGRPTAERAQECGRSERPAVMVGIGDETIALTRKRADFHLVTLREKGLCNRKPEGGDAIIPTRGTIASSSEGSERV